MRGKGVVFHRMFGRLLITRREKLRQRTRIFRNRLICYFEIIIFF